MADVPVVLRAQSIYLLLIGYRSILLAHFLQRGSQALNFGHPLSSLLSGPLAIRGDQQRLLSGAQ
jgi:hypothetical protein